MEIVKIESKLEKYQQDAKWLLAKQPKATQNTIEAFQQKVAVFDVDYGLNDKEARERAYFEMIGVFF